MTCKNQWPGPGVNGVGKADWPGYLSSGGAADRNVPVTCTRLLM